MSVRTLLPIAGLAIGGAFFLAVAGPRMVTPTAVDWAMQLDWRIHFLGWHIFRGEPWSWPPGALSGFLHAPSGTSIGYTDSIPLVAIPLKAVEGWLPLPMQYLGAWMLVCFALQGLFGVLLARFWTRSAAATLGAASLLAAQGKDLLQVALIMLAFGVGAALPLLLLGMLSRETLLRWRGRLAEAGKGGKVVLGILLIAVGLVIVSGFDKRLEAAALDTLPAWFTEISTRY